MTDELCTPAEARILLTALARRHRGKDCFVKQGHGFRASWWILWRKGDGVANLAESYLEAARLLQLPDQEFTARFPLWRAPHTRGSSK
jgi:hypothetical protein